MQNWNLADQIAGLGNARRENAAPENSGMQIAENLLGFDYCLYKNA